jgi:hypothetical protein
VWLDRHSSRVSAVTWEESSTHESERRQKVTKTSFFRERAPISSRLNAIDLYLVVCIFLVFGALMEYAVILLLLKKRRKPKYTIDMGLKRMFKNGDVAKAGGVGGVAGAGKSAMGGAGDELEDNGNKVRAICRTTFVSQVFFIPFLS